MKYIRSSKLKSKGLTMYKVGDKVKYIRCDIDHGITESSLAYDIGTIFTISKTEFHLYGIQAVRLRELGDHWYMPVKCIEHLIKKAPPKNDIEWMDRVQENFKE